LVLRDERCTSSADKQLLLREVLDDYNAMLLSYFASKHLVSKY